MSQVWLITGSSRGLGSTLAHAVLKAGHRLVATAREPTRLDDLRDAYGDQVRTVALDVTDAGAARQAVQVAMQAFGRLDVLVNNAARADLGSIEDMSVTTFDAQLDTVFRGVVNVTRAALPVLRRQGFGHVIQISSMGGRMGTAGLAAYQSAQGLEPTAAIDEPTLESLGIS